MARLHDLWRLLHQPDEVNPTKTINWPDINRHIGQALKLVDYAHRCNKTKYRRRTLTYVEGFEWYLRDTYRSPEGIPKKSEHIPQRLLGDNTETEINAFGQKWPNPVKLIRALLDSHSGFESTVGPVHGDLHPKNIVLGLGDSVHIIDFGWARSEAPIVVDYLLLDINLRSITLPSHLPETEVVAIADFLDQAQDPAALPQRLQKRALLIKEEIWAPLTAKGIVRDWLGEYLIPFFIMAYGLLVHLDAARNQQALIASVLAAGRRIAAERPLI